MTESGRSGRLQRAMARVRSILHPPSAFISGHRVYEPDSTDESASGSLKRHLFSLASVALEQAERAVAGRAGTVTFDTEVYEQIESEIDPAEQQEFKSFAAAIEDLIDEINAPLV